MCTWFSFLNFLCSIGINDFEMNCYKKLLFTEIIFPGWPSSRRFSAKVKIFIGRNDFRVFLVRLQLSGIWRNFIRERSKYRNSLKLSFLFMDLFCCSVCFKTFKRKSNHGNLVPLHNPGIKVGLEKILLIHNVDRFESWNKLSQWITVWRQHVASIAVILGISRG